MPVGARKNLLYGLALPVLGRRRTWRRVRCDAPGECAPAVERALKRGRVVGGVLQTFRDGKLTESYACGAAALSPYRPATADTVFRTASIAKMVTALLVMRLQTLGQLNVKESAETFWGAPIRNPRFPDTSITLAQLMSHTSSIVDSPAYFRSLNDPAPLSALLADGLCYADRQPGAGFQYSNLAAGMIGCLLEKRFGCSLEQLAQRDLFGPLRVNATFDLSTLAQTADDYRVLPVSSSPCFDAVKRIAAAKSVDQPDPETHYTLASGSLFLTARDLARLALPLLPQGFLNEECLRQMKTPVAAWNDDTVPMRHGLGLLCMDDRAIAPKTLYGHQGFAYGAVNGVFFDDQGSGFAWLNSGASEQRTGHLSCLNRELIAALWKEKQHV